MDSETVNVPRARKQRASKRSGRSRSAYRSIAARLKYRSWRANWMSSAAFQHGHKAHGEQGPVSTHSELWQFDVVQHEDAPAS